MLFDFNFPGLFETVIKFVYQNYLEVKKKEHD